MPESTCREARSTHEEKEGGKGTDEGEEVWRSDGTTCTLITHDVRSLLHAQREGGGEDEDKDKGKRQFD